MGTEFPYAVFKDHEIKTILDTPQVRKFRFQKPGEWTYGFDLILSDGLILMMGDCYTLVVEPGYGRPGLGFLRGSVENVGYFLSKVPECMRDSLKEYSREKAHDVIKEYHKEGYITDEVWEEFKENLSCEVGPHGEMLYHALCYDLNIEEPPRATILTPQTELQIAGLTVFVQKYNATLGAK